MERKLIKSVEDFVVYQKAVKLFEDFLEEDLPYLRVGEARGRYKRLHSILPRELAAKRVSVLNEIRAMLEALIKNWK